MADYSATARTNPFLVKDVTAFKNDLGKFGITAASWDESRLGAEFVIDEDESNKPQGAIALFSFGAWPSLDEESIIDRLNIEDDDEAEIPEGYEGIHELVAAHLVEGEVAIFMEVGTEKMRYLGGMAVAVNSAGETRCVDLDSIYELAKELTSDSSTITHAAY